MIPEKLEVDINESDEHYAVIKWNSGIRIYLQPERAAEIVRRYNGYADQQKELNQARVQLAGCGVAAMGNTVKTIAQRAKKGDYGWSASYGDVCAAVDREMKYREQIADQQKLIEQLVEVLESSKTYIDGVYGTMLDEVDEALTAAKREVTNGKSL